MSTNFEEFFSQHRRKFHFILYSFISYLGIQLSCTIDQNGDWVPLVDNNVQRRNPRVRNPRNLNRRIRNRRNPIRRVRQRNVRPIHPNLENRFAFRNLAIGRADRAQRRSAERALRFEREQTENNNRRCLA